MPWCHFLNPCSWVLSIIGMGITRSCYCRQFLFSYLYYFEFAIGNGSFHYYKIHFLNTLNKKCIKFYLFFSRLFEIYEKWLKVFCFFSVWLLGHMRKWLTQIHGCFRASEAVMRLAGLMVSILLMRSLASGVTVSHSGDGNFKDRN